MTLLAVFLLATVTTASAGGSAGERIYADSFGNLVIHSPAGFKRIVVGKGHMADELSRGGDHQPQVVYLEERRRELYLRKRDECRYGALLHGRSYMYGLPDNAVPVPRYSCP